MLRRLRVDILVVATLAVAVLLTVLGRPARAEGERVIAVPELHAMTPEASDDAIGITAELRRRFQSVPSLRVVDAPKAPTDVPGYPDNVPPFALWRDSHVDIVLIGNTVVLKDGRHRLSVRIWDLAKRVQIVGHVFVYSPQLGYEQEIADVVRNALVEALEKENEPERP
ncbi:hypothetical protein ACQR2D_09955 [Bradyrhizobium sp. HKCCYLRH2057]